MKKGKKVIVALSGGVDSAVSAALLKDAGYNVLGVFIKTWHPDFLRCTWKDDRREAMRVAAHLDIPFTTVDYSEEYRTEVAQNFIESYRRGETPNPDVLCNRYIKFGALAKYAESVGVDAIATGHYAAIQESKEGLELHQGVDATKDQSYFLWMLTLQDLTRIHFPLGKLRKEEVRKHAETYGLPNAARKDSQGICFLGDVDVPAFLGRFISLQEGAVMDIAGVVIGSHRGAALYTLGQRHGFVTSKKGSSDAPLYVIGTDISKNTITVGSKEEVPQYTKLHLRECNWIGTPTVSAEAQVRYHGVKIPCEIEWKGTEATIRLKDGVVVAPGQSVVLFSGTRVLGGGILASAS